MKFPLTRSLSPTACPPSRLQEASGEGGGRVLVFKGLIGYKCFLEVNEMKSKRFWTILFLSGSLLILFALPSYGQAQKQARTLTILYSNNINGEIEPCPT